MDSMFEIMILVLDYFYFIIYNLYFLRCFLSATDCATLLSDIFNEFIYFI